MNEFIYSAVLSYRLNLLLLGSYNRASKIWYVFRKIILCTLYSLVDTKLKTFF